MHLTMVLSVDRGLGVMYRYREWRYSLGCDEFDNPYPGHRLEVACEEYPITKRTAKGVKIEVCPGYERFVANDTRKRFACETKELAKEQFRYRKLAQRRILKAQLADVEQALKLIDG